VHNIYKKPLMRCPVN